MKIQRAKSLIIAAAGSLILLVIAVLYHGVPLAMDGRADLSQLYTAGYMVRTGQSRLLYDYNSQRQIQATVVSPEGVPLPFDHPSYEALLFVPLARVGYRSAYQALLFVNVAMLTICICILWPRFTSLSAIWGPLPAVIFLCFLPIAITLVQGQDSILLLSLMAAAAVFLENEHEVLAGIFLGLGLFKFQFVIPTAVLFALWRRWRFVEGFAISGAVAGLVSAFIAGWEGIVNYARLLLSLSSRLSTGAEQLKFGVYPSGMANLRGLCSVLFHFSTRAGFVATLLASIAAVVYVARKRCSFELAVLAAALLSFHGLIHDMSVLVIPAGVMLSDGLKELNTRRIWLGVLLLILPSLLFLTGSAYFLLTIPMIAALIVASNRWRPGRAAS